MAQVNAGRVRFISRGEYNNSTQYYLFDLVDYNGSSYFAKANTIGNVPTNTTYWQLVAEKGNTGNTGPVGPTGNGIASIIKTASAGLIDTYTITFTDGTTTTFNITNGQDGDVTQEYVDEENERLKSVFNVLPKVSDSGESVELENTGDTMLYKMDLKGNTSQEVVSGEVGLEVEDTSIYVDDVNESKENYITLKGNTSQSILPSGYTQVDYIECTGTQYIDTGYTPVQNDEFEIKNITTSVDTNGAIISAGTENYQLIIMQLKGITYYRYFKSGSASRFSQYRYDNNTIVLNKDGEIYVDGKLKATNSYGGAVNSSLNIFRRADGTAYFVGRIGELIITNNNVKKRHFIPCYRNSDNEAGLYDIVNDTFYTNAGTGDFTYGNVVPTPDAPQEIEVVTGLNKVEVCGKNVFNIAKLENSSWNFPNANTRVSMFLDKVAQGTKMSVTNRDTTTYRYAVGFAKLGYASRNNIIVNESGWQTASTYTITASDEGYPFLQIARIDNGNISASEVEGKFQYEYGDTATTYEPYKGQTYPVNLGSIELCKIGTYQDRIYKSNGNWYLHKETGKVVLDGTGYWGSASEGDTTNGFSIFTTTINNILEKTSKVLYCDMFKYISRDELTSSSINFVLSGSENVVVLNIDRTLLAEETTTGFRNWLNTNQPLLYYPLQTPTETQITDTTLISQLNALYNATIYSTTHINTETSNLLPYINLKYNVVTASPSPEKASEVEVVKGNNTITISNEDGTKTQTYNITLGNLELCKIGDYQDYIYKSNDNWYKNSQISKVTLNGTEKWSYTSETFLIGSITNYKLVGENICISSHFISQKNVSSTSELLDKHIAFRSDSSTKRLYIKDSDITSASDFTNWLSSNNVTLYYILQTPTTTQITDQLLVSQLDELQKAMSYYDKTIITQTNADKPFILDVVGIRDLQDIFNI